MKQEPRTRVGPEEPGDQDDIEILEVVGLDENGRVPREPDEVVVTFDEDPAASERAEPREEEDARERLLRLRADFENLSKRIERERSSTIATPPRPSSPGSFR
jgi:molecular chaperone GrpE (heat shock protein)